MYFSIFLRFFKKLNRYWVTKQLLFMCYKIVSIFCYPFFFIFRNFIFRKIFVAFMMILTFLSFSSSERFDIFHVHTFSFLRLFQKDFDTFHGLFFKPLFVFLIISGRHFYLCKKITDWFFIFSEPLEITLIILISSHLTCVFYELLKITCNHLKSFKNHLNCF